MIEKYNQGINDTSADDHRNNLIDANTIFVNFLDSKTSWGQHGAHLGPVGPDGSHVGPMNLAFRVYLRSHTSSPMTVL